jgi:predicted protein tyrosine phosphatase
MEIRILGYIAASHLLEREPLKWNALVILDSGVTASQFVQRHTIAHRYLHFDDVEKSYEMKRSPSASAIKEGLEFAKAKERLLVSCRAGQSRSAAIAYLISCQEQGVAQAIKLLDPMRHRPNRLVIEIGASLLGDSQILDHFKNWKENLCNSNLADYLDVLRKELDALEAAGASNRITDDRTVRGS